MDGLNPRPASLLANCGWRGSPDRRPAIALAQGMGFLVRDGAC